MANTVVEINSIAGRNPQLGDIVVSSPVANTFFYGKVVDIVDDTHVEVEPLGGVNGGSGGKQVSTADGETLIGVDNTDSQRAVIFSTEALRDAVTATGTLQEGIAAVDSALADEVTRATNAESALSTRIAANTNDTAGLKTRVDTTEGNINDIDGRLEDIEAYFPVLPDAVDAIKGVMPTQATHENQLATQDFVNSSISNMAARHVTQTAAGDTQWTSLSDLRTGPWYHRGQPYTPTINDYAIFTNTDGSTWRASFDGVQWNAEWKVNDTPFTAAQLAALNSNITQGLTDKLVALPYNAALQTALNSKAENSSLVSHTEDDNIHVSAEDRREWGSPIVGYIPDYANIESTNRISALNGTWTADRDGFVLLERTKTGGTWNSMSAWWEIGGILVLGATEYFVRAVLPIARGQTVKAVSNTTISGAVCRYIPPLPLHMRAFIPDYERIVDQANLISGQQWTVPDNGFVRFFMTSMASTWNGERISISINGTPALGTSPYLASYILPVGMGDIITFSATVSGSGVNLSFIPARIL
jgi:hypothetical protein